MDFLHLTLSFTSFDSHLAQLIDWNVSDHDKHSVFMRLMLAAIFGGLLGWERRRADKPADIRTMVLIGTGAAAFTLIGQQLIATSDNDAIIRADPTRVLSYIISGVGFLGAGAILHSKKTIIGLTTAASIWVVAAIGAACGVGEFMIAFFLFAIAFVTLWTPWVFAMADGTLDDDVDSSNGN
jgi:putative Mg2+ transporter-C (MgtC) family protein